MASLDNLLNRSYPLREDAEHPAFVCLPMSTENGSSNGGNGRTTNRDIWDKLEAVVVSLTELKVRTEPLAGLPLLSQLVGKNTDELARHHDKIIKLQEKVDVFDKMLERFRGRAEAKLTAGKVGVALGVLSALVVAVAGTFEIIKTFL